MRYVPLTACFLLIVAAATRTLDLWRAAAFAQPAPGWRLEWKHSGLDVAGKPESIRGFKIWLARASEAPIAPRETIGITAHAMAVKIAWVRVEQCGAATPGCSLDLTGFMGSGIADGRYDVYVLAEDRSGNVSEWAGPLAVDKGVVDITAPAKPSDLRATRDP